MHFDAFFPCMFHTNMIENPNENGDFQNRFLVFGFWFGLLKTDRFKNAVVYGRVERRLSTSLSDVAGFLYSVSVGS